MRRLVILTIAALCSGCPKKPDPQPVPQHNSNSEPTRIIMMIGDGMGIGAVTAGAYAKGEPLKMMSAEEFAWITTYEQEFVTTDSAAAATALATGVKTHFNGVSVKPGTTKENENDLNNHLETWFESAKKRKLGTGIVTTSRVNHATPAAFVSHRATRKSYDDIARDIVKFGPDVLLGSGAKYFHNRKDGLDLFEAFQRQGYTVANDPAVFREQQHDAKKIVGLFYEKDTPFITKEPRKVPLPEMTESAIKILDRTHPQGWVLMVEGSFIDWCAHNLDPQCLIAETLEFDDAIGKAYDYADSREDVLVVVTADHETGGLSILSPSYTAPFEKALGGEEKINAATKVGALVGEPSEFPNPVQHLAIPPGQFQNEMLENADQRFTAVWGDLSVGSAAHWDNKKGRYYAAHTAESVPLWAKGPRDKWIAQARDNAEVGRRIKSIVEKTVPIPVEPAPVQKPKNIIVMIGDGLGIASIDALNYNRGSSAILDLPIHGFASTHSTDGVVTDSAASATALATGTRVAIGNVGRNKSGKLKTLADYALEQQRKFGIITTTELTHATPGAFYANQLSRSDKSEIAKDLQSSKISFFAGGGTNDLGPISKSIPGYETSWPPTTNGRVIALGGKGLERARTRRNDNDPSTPTLSEMTQFAIEKLQNENGFVLVVEGGQIDWAKHDFERGVDLLEEIRDFEDAVKTAVEFTNGNTDTLLVVTADHDHTMSILDSHYAFRNERCGSAKECGGTHNFPKLPVATEGRFDTTLNPDWSPTTMRLQYAWIAAEVGRRDPEFAGPHSARFVPVFALGAGSEAFRGFMDQPEIGSKLISFTQP